MIRERKKETIRKQFGKKITRQENDTEKIDAMGKWI